jgi:hypothetical protein
MDPAYYVDSPADDVAPAPGPAGDNQDDDDDDKSDESVPIHNRRRSRSRRTATPSPPSDPPQYPFDDSDAENQPPSPYGPYNPNYPAGDPDENPENLLPDGSPVGNSGYIRAWSYGQYLFSDMDRGSDASEYGHVSVRLRELIAWCMTDDPRYRPSLRWLEREVRMEIEKNYGHEPDEGLSATEMKEWIKACLDSPLPRQPRKEPAGGAGAGDGSHGGEQGKGAYGDGEGEGALGGGHW